MYECEKRESATFDSKVKHPCASYMGRNVCMPLSLSLSVCVCVCVCVCESSMNGS